MVVTSEKEAGEIPGMIHAIYIYLIIGAWLAGVNSMAGIIRTPVMMLVWPIVLIYIWRQNRKYKKESGS